MTHVFVSYARKDWAIANALVQELEARGFQAWWDRELIAGATFQTQIADKLDAARAAIVIWSDSAARSDWVIGEAARAANAGKLIATRLPDHPYNRIPRSFREQQTESVADIDKIVRALIERGIEPAKLDGSIGKPQPGDRIARSIVAHKAARTSQLTYFLPIMILFLSMILAVGLVVVANTIGIGWVRWAPQGAASQGFVKEVGYVPAVTWSFASILLFPLAWALIALALENLKDIPGQVIRNQMLVTTELEPITYDDPRFVRFFTDVRRMTVLLSVCIVLLVGLIAFQDYYVNIFLLFQDPELARDLNRIGPGASYPIDHHAIERDWSVAALLTRADGVATPRTANLVFAFVAYLIYSGLGVGLVLAFFTVLVGTGMFFLPGAARRYGLQIVPSIESIDRRRGFECFSGLFANAMSIVAVSFCACYVLQLQNIYLRLETPNLASFVWPKVALGLEQLRSGQIGSGLDHLLGNSLADHIPSGGVQGVLAWIASAVMVMSLLGIAYLFMRASALRGRARLIEELEAGGDAALLRLTELPAEQVRRRLEEMRPWPVKGMRLGTFAAWYLVTLSGLLFYKLGLLLVPAALAFAIYITCTTPQDA